MHTSFVHSRRSSSRTVAGLVAILATCAVSDRIAFAQGAAPGSDDAPGAQRQELLFFVSAKSTQLHGLDTPMFDDNEATPVADVFYSRSSDRFRMLLEYLITDDEHDLERFQVGWQLSETTRVWLGRFHQSASFWNTEHHHGQFLQTAINRPAIEEWEDLGGVLPSHTTGILIEHQQEIGNEAGVQLSVSAGATGTIIPQQIEPFDLLDPDGRHGASVSLRAGFFPEFLGDDQVGVTLGHYELDVEPGAALPASWDSDVGHVDLTTLGLYTDWNWEQWRLTAVVNRVRSEPHGGLGGPRTEFVASYLQTEYRFAPTWTAYGRIEGTSGEEDYLEIFPQYVHEQSVLGLRWLIGTQHALSLELSDAELGNDGFNRVVLQWSAVLP